MLLGAIMRDLRRDTHAEVALLALGDIVLAAEVEAAREAREESIGEYVAGATQRFARLASDEDWMRLTRALADADQPAATCITTMVRWAIAKDAAEAQSPAAAGGCACGKAGCNGDT